jgi:dihydropteroate synthase
MASDSPLLARLAAQTRPLVMGVVNLTPDSFSDGGRLASVEAAVEHALALDGRGADILDFGAESTRPGAEDVPLDVELARLMPVLERLAGRTRALISVDTRKPQTMRQAAAAGAHIWNDVSALTFAPNSAETAAELSLPVVLMHAQGTPATMQVAPGYRDVTADVTSFLVSRIGTAVRAGLPRELILTDPGIGFGKTLDHNLTLMRDLKRIVALGRPVLFGASRKSFIARLDKGAADPLARLGGSLAAALWAAQAGAAILRVHDVHETVQALDVWQAIGEAP